MMPESMPNPAAAISQDSPQEDFSNGFQLTFRRTPQGYSVSDPEPLASSQVEEPGEAPEAGEVEGQYETVPTLAEAMKHIMVIVKENPLGNDEQGQLEAGYQAGRSA